MQTANTALEKRVGLLERQLRKMQSELRKVRPTSPLPWWERLAGTFENDPLFDEVVEAGQAYRRSLAPRKRSC